MLSSSSTINIRSVIVFTRPWIVFLFILADWRSDVEIRDEIGTNGHTFFGIRQFPYSYT